MQYLKNLHTEEINISKKDFIGVFDSGMGGVSTLIELKRLMPNENFYYFGDSENAPYGPKTSEEILNLSLNVADFLYKKRIKAIVIACNTATSISVSKLRKKYPDIPIIGVEPAVKLAVDTGGKHILVMATQTTIRENKFKNLVNKFNNVCTVESIACPELVQIVENDLFDNADICMKQLNEYFKKFDMNKIDTIVLGCTHFIFYKKYIREILGYKHIIVDGNLGTAKHLQQELLKRNLLSDNTEEGKIEFINSQIISEDTKVEKVKLSKRLFHEFK